MIFYGPLVHLWVRWYENHSPGELEAWMSLIAQVLGFLVPASIYTAIVYTFPTWSTKYRLQNYKPTIFEGLDALVTALVNVTTLVSMHTASLAVLRFKYTLFRVDASFPTAVEMLWQFVAVALIREVVFYYVHRLLHLPLLYRLFHEKHHRYKAPVALAAVYSHPIDHIFQNAMPIAVPLMVVRAHLVTSFFLAVYFQWDAALAHSGFSFTRLPEVEEHDRHHRDMKVNYGILGLMDWLHATDAQSGKLIRVLVWKTSEY